MKATGIVRRIDDLGRVVIPKEIRRTLRIREGDPLEIFTARDGEVILKKYSPIGELGEFAREYAESLHDALGFTALVADRDVIIAVAGAPRREFMEKRIGEVVEEAMERRETVIVNEPVPGLKPYEQTLLADDETDDRFSAYLVAPIVASGRSIGAVILGTDRTDQKVTDLEQRLAETAAGFLGRQME